VLVRIKKPTSFHEAMNEGPLQATIVDVVPLGKWLLLSVRGAE
jgi:hypothetical protein